MNIGVDQWRGRPAAAGRDAAPRRTRLECGANAVRPSRRPGPTIHDLAAQLHRLPPSCGPVRLIGVDGHAGSGKSTFAGRLAAALGGAPVLHLDDVASHDALFDWTGRLLTQVIEPLRRGDTAHYTPYDWRARDFSAPAPCRRPRWS